MQRLPLTRTNPMCYSCADSSSDFDFFILCAPYELGAGSILMVVGLMILFLSACCAACVRVDLQY